MTSTSHVQLLDCRCCATVYCSAAVVCATATRCCATASPLESRQRRKSGCIQPARVNAKEKFNVAEVLKDHQYLNAAVLNGYRDGLEARNDPPESLGMKTTVDQAFMFQLAASILRFLSIEGTSVHLHRSGYMAPEYAMHGQFSVKSDVFSYGVLVLEMITGQKNRCFQNDEVMEDLLSFAWKSWRNKTTIKMIDPILKTGSHSLHDIIRSIHIGLLCVQENAADRPTMASIVLMLNSFSVTLQQPSEPAFFMHTNTKPEMPLLYEYSSTSSSGLEKSKRSKSSQLSINDVSITEIVPR
ncbi:hypothetical protein SSX86_020006 [Deinandra increscens subsp. villosa]|uniref:Serine-threonine/tyrosine-protein kinase catalytic domain-containing protein n=1 Tax=Deinandra increscens subsp. villosa TaxID=3103831 RepID=A0AAP0CTN9_9ASTR